jgi:hypothetical protein
MYLVAVRKRAEQAKNFSHILNQDIMMKLKEMLDVTYAEFKRLTNLGKSADK